MSTSIVGATISVKVPSGVVPEFTKDAAMGSNVLPADVVPPPKVISLKKQALMKEWASWHEALKKLKLTLPMKLEC